MESGASSPSVATAAKAVTQTRNRCEALFCHLAMGHHTRPVRPSVPHWRMLKERRGYKINGMRKESTAGNQAPAPGSVTD